MIYGMNIDNYKDFFAERIAKRGISYYKNKRVLTAMKREDGKYQIAVRGDAQTYRVIVDIRKNGDIRDITCNCPYAGGNYYCKHEYAALLHLSDIFESDIFGGSSQYVSRLITAYTKNAVGKAEDPITIEPEITFGRDYSSQNKKLSFKLKIGREKKYIVNDISRLESDFNYQVNRAYGKNLEFVHNYNILDVRSRKLMELASLIHSQDG